MFIQSLATRFSFFMHEFSELLVPLERIDEGRNLVVFGLDLFDKTPVLDIKPYQSIYRTNQYKLPDWHIRLQERTGHV